MSIRRKLLLVLVGFALVPMFIAFGVGQISTRRVGASLSERAQSELLSEAMDRLGRYVNGASALVASQGQTVELIVASQARSFADTWDRGGAAADRVYLSREEIDTGARTPPGLTPHEAYAGVAGGVTFDAVSVLLAPDVQRAEVERDLEVHAGMEHSYRLLRSYSPDLVYFQYTCTLNGTHSVYPGHGGYPDGYEPRVRSWYVGAMEQGPWTRPGGVVWGLPMVDAATGAVVVTVSAPVVVASGRTVGVTTVDIRIRDLLDGLNRPPGPSPNEEVVIASLGESSMELGPTELEVWIARSYASAASDWRRPMEVQTFRLDDDESSRAVIDALRRGESGVLLVLRNGEPMLCAYAPILSDDRRAGAALLYTIPASEVVALAEEIDDQFWSVVVSQLSSNLGIAFVVLIAVVLIAWNGAKTVTGPVSRLAGAVARVAGGDLEARADVERRDEIGALAEDFNAMTAKLRDHVRLRNALELAKEVQQSLLPRGNPRLEGFDIEGRSVYCDETGGDYYDYLESEDERPTRLGVVMGDVTGHGVAAALLMATARSLLRSRATGSGSLAEQLTDVNHALSMDNDHGRFMTLFYLVLDCGGGEMRWATAGHDSAIVYDPSSDRFHELEAVGGIPLGIEPDWRYEDRCGGMIDPGAILLLGTDGIWEARDGRAELFGKDRLRAVIRANSKGTAGEICDAILAAVTAFRVGTPQLDDITLVVVRRLGATA